MYALTLHRRFGPIAVHLKEAEYYASVKDELKDEDDAFLVDILETIAGRRLYPPIDPRLDYFDVNIISHRLFLEALAARDLVVERHGMDYMMSIFGFRRPQGLGEQVRALFNKGYIPEGVGNLALSSGEQGDLSEPEGSGLELYVDDGENKF